MERVSDGGTRARGKHIASPQGAEGDNGASSPRGGREGRGRGRDEGPPRRSNGILGSREGGRVGVGGASRARVAVAAANERGTATGHVCQDNRTRRGWEGEIPRGAGEKVRGRGRAARRAVEKSRGGIGDVPSALTRRVAPREVGAVTRAGARIATPRTDLDEAMWRTPETVAKDVEADMVCVLVSAAGSAVATTTKRSRRARCVKCARESAPGPTRNIPGCRAGRSTTPSSCPANVTAQSALREPRIDGSKRTN